MALGRLGLRLLSHRGTAPQNGVLGRLPRAILGCIRASRGWYMDQHNKVKSSFLGVAVRKCQGIVPQIAVTGLDKRHLETSFKSLNFRNFVLAVIQRTRPNTVTLIGALIYLDRLSSRLDFCAKGQKETSYRVFVTALILSDKFLNDKVISNSSWATLLQPWFSPRELCNMERQFLKCIGYDLDIKTHHIYQLILGEPELFNFAVEQHISCIQGFNEYPFQKPELSLSTMKTYFSDLSLPCYH